MAEKGELHDSVHEKVARLLLENLGTEVYPSEKLKADISAAIYLGYCFAYDSALDQWLIRFAANHEVLPPDEETGIETVQLMFDEMQRITGGLASYWLFDGFKWSLGIMEVLEKAKSLESADFISEEDPVSNPKNRARFENFVHNLDVAIAKQVQNEPSVNHMMLWHTTEFGDDFGPDSSPTVTGMIRQGQDWKHGGKGYGRVETLETVLECALQVLRSRNKVRSYLGPVLAERILRLFSSLASDGKSDSADFEWWPEKIPELMELQGLKNRRRGASIFIPENADFRRLFVLWLRDRGASRTELRDKFYPQLRGENGLDRVSRDLGKARKVLLPARFPGQRDLVCAWTLKQYADGLQRIRPLCLKLMKTGNFIDPLGPLNEV